MLRWLGSLQMSTWMGRAWKNKTFGARTNSNGARMSSRSSVKDGQPRRWSCGGTALCRRCPATGPMGFCRALQDETFSARTDSIGVQTRRGSPVKVPALLRFRYRRIRSGLATQIWSQWVVIPCGVRCAPLLLAVVGWIS